MRKVKVNIKQKLCKVGAFMLILTFFLSVLSCISERFFPLFIFSLVDAVITIVPSFYLIITVKDEEVECGK